MSAYASDRKRVMLLNQLSDYEKELNSTPPPKPKRKLYLKECIDSLNRHLLHIT